MEVVIKKQTTRSIVSNINSPIMAPAPKTDAFLAAVKAALLAKKPTRQQKAMVKLVRGMTKE